MNNLNLISLYKDLKLPVVDKEIDLLRFSACHIPGYENHRLAKDKNNCPSILIATKGKPETRPSSLNLEHLQILFDVDCRISQDSKLQKYCFTVVSCTEQDPQIQEYFLRVGSAIVAAIGKEPTHTQVSKAVENLVELFRVMHEVPKKSVQGLWSELLLMTLPNSPSELMRSWHISPEDKYDFSNNDQRIEVKSSNSRSRLHHFSLEQLNPSKGVNVLITSIFVERTGTGKSVAELSDIVRSKIAKEPDLLIYLDLIIGKSLGRDWRSAAKDRFDYSLAKKSILFYLSNVVPKINSDIPREVSNVHFQVDLTNITPTNKKIIRKDGGIFEAVSK